MAELDRWLASNPKSPLADKARLARARLEAAHGDLERAIALFKKFLADCPQGALSETARAGMEDASRAKSIADAQKERERARADAARANPVQARVEAAEALLAKGKFREAVRAFGSLRNTVGPAMRDRVLYGLGEAMRGNGDSWGALETLRAVARSGAASTNGAYAARANRAIGDIRLEDTGDYDGAVAAYGKFLAMRPDLAGPGFWMNYGLALMASGRGEEAAQVFSGRRDQAAGDPAEFAKWDNMVKKCGQGRERQREAVQERGALAAMYVAEALLDGDEPGRALKMFRRVSPVARRLGLGDRCAIGEAECLAALGRDKAALKAYDEFAKKHPKSPLASGALLRAGVLCASPAMNDFREARKRFDAIVGKYPSAPEAEAAEFYSATLAWREGKWAEAGRLHRAFAERHPGSPLARVATEERLPAIAAKSLEVPRSAGGGYEYVVVVSTDDRVRHSIYVAEGASLNAVLKVRPESGWVLKSSRLRDMNSRGVGGLWTRKGSSHSGEHVYHLCNAFSSQEFAMIDGVLIPEGEGEEPEERLFRVAVPSVDVDWSGFASPGDENGEETRHILVPLNPNGPGDIRQVLLQSPYDDDERQGRSSFPYGSRVPPTITLKWSPANSASLLRDGEDDIPSGWSVNARNIQNWPVSFDVQPLASSETLTIYCEGQSSSSGKASDRILGRFVNVDLDVDANYDGVIDDDDEAIEMSQGGLVGAGATNLAPVKLTVSPFGTLPGKIKLSATSGGGRIRVWEDRWRTFEVLLPRTWDAEELFSTTLYVEGVSPSVSMRDTELKLEYDENPEGQNNALLKCEDHVKLTVKKAQMIGYAAWRGTDGKAVPDEEKDNPGFLVTKQSSGHLSAKVKLKGLPNVGLLRYYKFSRAGLVLANGQTTTAEEVAIPHDDDFDMTLDMTDPSNWGDDSYVDVEYILRDAQGNLFDQDKCRLLRPYVVAVGDSLTYGLMRWQHKFQTPRWDRPWSSYPSAATWEDTNFIAPEYAVSGHRLREEYQGYRGYLSEKLPGFTWLGLDTNGHGPSHKGYPGATISDVVARTDNSVLGISPSYTFIIYFAGMNNCTHGNITSMNPSPMQQWLQGVVNIKNQRLSNGRTLLLALQLPQVGLTYMDYLSGNNSQEALAVIQDNIEQFNGIVGAYEQNLGNFIGINVELGINHQNDDGLHFSSTGYQTMANYIFNAIKESLK